jgi:hypothetical protein
VALVVVWSQGGSATIEVLEGERIELVSTRAFAPGSRPEGTVSLGASSSEASTIWLKVHGSRRQDDGSFLVVGKLLNVTRAARERLKEAFLGENGGKTGA